MRTHESFSRSLQRRLGVLLAALVPFGGVVGAAQQAGSPDPWEYHLVHDAYLLDDCPICDRISLPVPMRGTFRLRFVDATPISTRYALEDIQFTTAPWPWRVTGGGTLEISGEVVAKQTLELQVQIDDGATNQICYLTNSTVVPNRLWPMMDVTVLQTNGTMSRVYSLRLAAAPLREIWFSTTNSFTATAGASPIPFVESGDLLSTVGRVVRRNADFFTAMGVFLPVPNIGLDDVTILSGGDIAFSFPSDLYSPTLGNLQHGDLLSTAGRILYRNQELLAPFGPQPPAMDAGLDAVNILDSGSVLFSIQSNVFSEKLGVTLHRGDLLSNAGQIVRDYQQLLGQFHPTNTSSDFGLDALYVWPNGEIWFSTEDGFYDQILGPILGGDLLSDSGYIAYRNDELVSAFAPTEKTSDQGLDAIYVVTDATPRLSGPSTIIAPSPPTSGVSLSWRGGGKVFQLERADNVTGPFKPIGPISPDQAATDDGVLTNLSSAFYHVRQW